MGDKLTLDFSLYVVSTPIGNLSDVSRRAVEVLGGAGILACEDTRHTRKLLSHYGIDAKRLVSYHEHNEKERAEELLDELKRGVSVAIVSDAGAPLLSDPGYRLVRAAAEAGIPVIAIPGPSAVTTALQVSGLPPVPFSFLGFPPSKAAARRRFFAEFVERRDTLMCFESIHRIRESLVDMEAVFGDRKAALCRELTKLHEEVLRGTLSQIRHTLETRKTLAGEVTMVIEGASADAPPEGVTSRAGASSPAEHLRRLFDAGRPPSDAAREAAHVWGIPRKEAYRLALAIKKKQEY